MTNEARFDVAKVAIWMACLVVPGLLAVMTAAAFLGSQSQHRSGSDLAPVALSFRIVADAGSTLGPAEALEMLRQAPAVERETSNRREHPFWLLIDLPATRDGARWMDLPSRHAQTAVCWRPQDQRLLGEATRSGTRLAMQPALAGFVLDLAKVPPTDRVLCKATFSGPARISAQLWNDEDLAQAALLSGHQAGFLKGGILLLTLFSVILAALGRDLRFVLLAVWLVLGLRMGQLSLGLDLQWLGQTLPPDWMPQIRKLTIALFYMTTLQLHLALRPPELVISSAREVFVAVSQWTTLALLGLAVLLPYGHFLPAMWAIVCVGIVAMIWDMTSIVRSGASRPTIWFGVAILTVIAASLWEIAAAAVGVPTYGFNHQSAILLASCFVVAAFAVQMREQVRERKLAQATLSRTYNQTPVGLFTLDAATGVFLRANRALQSLLGPAAGRGTPSRWQDYFGATSWAQLQQAHRTPEPLQRHWRGLEPLSTRNFRVTAVRVADRIEGSVEDVTERTEATARLQHLAEHDALTDALTRVAFERHLSAALGPQGEETASCTLMLINLRRFKVINDLYGLPAGDAALREVSRRLRVVLGSTALLGRMGSDRFAVLLPNRNAADVEALARVIVDALQSAPLQLGERTLRFKAGVGVTDITRDMAPSDALALAENAAQAARDDRAVVIYTRTCNEIRDWTSQYALMRLLEQPNGFDGLHMHYQPIIALRNPSQAHNFEALLRMRHPDGRSVPVGQLLAAAEAGGLMTKVDLWVVEQVLQWLQAHRERLGHTRFVCVNLSGTSLNDPDFADAIATLLSRYAEVAPLLCLEVTETVALEDFVETRAFMARLKTFGVRFALDDFGAGYSSYAYLMELPVEVLKIDGSLVRDVARHPAHMAIVSSIAHMSADLGLRCIAEWVEDAHTLAALVEAGVDYVQGFGLARPLSPDDVLQHDSGAGFVTDPEIRAQLLALDTAPGDRAH